MSLRGAVGRRVVVRYRLGTTTALADVLGLLEAIEADGTVVVRRDRDQESVRIAAVEVVAGKPVPPRPPRRHLRA